MSIAQTIQAYLADHRAPFDMVAHPHTASSLNTANQAKIKPSALAKAVLFEDDLERGHFVMAVIPATHRVILDELSRQAGRRMHLASEDDVARVFADCEVGAIPPLGPAYGIETIVDDSLGAQAKLYFEAGDHEHLVHVEAKDLFALLPNCARGRFSGPM